MHITHEPDFPPQHQVFLDAVCVFDQIDLNSTINRRFKAQVRAHGDKTAVKSDSTTLSYCDVDRIGNRVAAAVDERSACRDLPIALAFENPALLIAAIFGVLRSGRPYLVLDPDYPVEHLKQTLSHSGARLLMTQGELPILSRSLQADAVDHLQFDEIHQREDYQSPVSVTNASPALLMYTSGSTGQPVGVLHSHRSILAKTAELTNCWKIGWRDVLLQYASCAFASSIRTIFTSLLNGATLVIYNLAKSGFQNLEATIRDNHISVIRSLPTPFRRFLQTVKPARVFDSVRMLSLGGETVTPTDVDLFNRFFAPHAVLTLSYGPTECLTACWGFAHHQSRHNGGKIPLGFARPHKTLSIIDDTGTEVEPGTEGELYVRGSDLALGYWRNPVSSSARFIEHDDGSKTFKTGDIARQNPDGSFTHLGRADFQVKLRGFRIDILEIENAIRTLDQVADVAVAPHKDGEQNLELHAYMVAEQGHELDIGMIRKMLQLKLPPQAIPAHLFAIDSLPTNNNGKLDRRALFNLSADSEPGSLNDENTSGDTYTIVRNLWLKALKQNDLSDAKTFVESGGDSLQAAELAYHIQMNLGVELSLTDILFRLTPGQLTEKINQTVRPSS